MKRGLGRGLDSLLSGGAPTSEKNSPVNGKLTQLSIDQLQTGKYQPRQEIAKESLQELADSIRAQGIIQPIVVRSVTNGRYEIIAGERRWRAAQLAGLSDVPVLIRDVKDEAAIAMALIENIQREDLNPIEEAIALQRLLEEFSLTQQQVGDAVGKSRATVTNLIRLLELPAPVKKLIQDNLLSQGHAKVLLALTSNDQTKAAQMVVDKNLSVRQTEHLVKHWQQTLATHKKSPTADPDILKLEQRLSDRLGTQVKLEHTSKGRGKLVIHYQNLEILDGILERLEEA